MLVSQEQLPILTSSKELLVLLTETYSIVNTVVTVVTIWTTIAIL